jgi:hypothetical protein
LFSTKRSRSILNKVGIEARKVSIKIVDLCKSRFRQSKIVRACGGEARQILRSPKLGGKNIDPALQPLHGEPQVRFREMKKLPRTLKVVGHSHADLMRFQANQDQTYVNRFGPKAIRAILDDTVATFRHYEFSPEPPNHGTDRSNQPSIFSDTKPARRTVLESTEPAIWSNRVGVQLASGVQTMLSSFSNVRELSYGTKGIEIGSFLLYQPNTE